MKIPSDQMVENVAIYICIERELGINLRDIEPQTEGLKDGLAQIH